MRDDVLVEIGGSGISMDEDDRGLVVSLLSEDLPVSTYAISDPSTFTLNRMKGNSEETSVSGG